MANYFGLLPAQFTRKAIDFISSNYQNPTGNPIKTLTLIALSIFGVILIRGVLLFFMRQTIIVMSRHIEYDMKNEIYAHYQQLDMQFYARSNTGDLMNRISEDVGRVRMYTGPAIMYLVNIIVLVVVVLIAMLHVNLKLTLVVLAPLPLLVLLIYYVQNIINEQSEQVQQSLSTLSTSVQESFAGIRIIKSFAAEKLFFNQFNNHARNYFNQSMKLARINALFIPAIMLLVGISSITVIYYGGLLVESKQITFGNIAEFVIYLNMLMWPVGMMGWIIALIQRADASQRRINEFLYTEPAIDSNHQGKTYSEIEFVQFQDVSFGFSKKTMDLQHLNFSLQKGQTVAILGSTGSGKTTIANLISKMIEPTHGSILVNQSSVNELQTAWWRNQIGYVTQDVLLFSDTIFNNIIFGYGNAPADEVIKASKMAMIFDEVEHFKDGFNTMLGERGVNLSGGQKQRLAIARAIVRNPQIMILDDCLSALDTQTEEKLIQNLIPFLKDRITLILSHRVSSVKYADQIIIIENGGIIEQGTHETLVQLNGIYAGMLTNQQLSDNSMSS
jgi:ATP-binding cassette subfamily B protein